MIFGILLRIGLGAVIGLAVLAGLNRCMPAAETAPTPYRADFSDLPPEFVAPRELPDSTWI